MQIKQAVTVNRPREEVWALFQDIPAVAGCMPGAELTRDDGNGAYAGIVSIKLGPFKAAFEGEVQHTPDPANFSGKAEGRGIDKKGGSRSRMTMNYLLLDKGEATDLEIEAEVQLSGPVAQFGRPGIVSETAKLLIQQFVSNIEAELNGEGGSAGSAKDISALKLSGKVVGASVKRWLGKEG
ncbi:MAG: SRPBCC family protein [Mesorhizobium sp.]|nr:SRPBCC family protein [Mesorhizobium sp.]MBL8576372.1 SRPBCC family protein [Mesorhizobium sp.]